MLWQDALFTAGNLFFAAALVPTLRDRRSAVPRWSSVPNAAVLASFVLPEASLALWGTAAMSALMAVGWVGIALWRPVPKLESEPTKCAYASNVGHVGAVQKDTGLCAGHAADAASVRAALARGDLGGGA